MCRGTYATTQRTNFVPELSQSLQPGCEFVLRVRCALLGASGRQLLFLMTVFAKTLFALVCSHLVAFTFFSAGHDAIGLCLTIEICY